MAATLQAPPCECDRSSGLAPERGLNLWWSATMTPDALRTLIEIPVVGAPLAGGASTPELAAAVCEGGGLGFIAAGYKTVDEVRRAIEQVRAHTRRPFGVNI